ncbi:MAG: biotin--[acetyl-CoA-carboxylase] ligase [Minisyncoccales bacterium]
MSFVILKYKKVSSTQKKLKELIEKNKAKDWLVCLSEEQEAGKGKGQRNWFSPKGGLYFSVLLPQSCLDDVQTLTFLSAFVVAKILKEDFNLEPFIKLPNDVYLGSKKVCGILTENFFKGRELLFSIIGIGLNTNIKKFSPSLEKEATSIFLETGKKVSNRRILEKILKGLKNQLTIISS